MTIAVQQHYVTFYSPGSFAAEQSARKIDAWNIEAAKAMVGSIKERHGATPYGFRFTTRGRGPDDLDSKEIAQSPFYYLGGRIETIDEVRARADPNERILLSNMECNRWDRIVVNDNSWRWSQPLNKDDVVLDWTPPNLSAEKVTI